MPKRDEERDLSAKGRGGNREKEEEEEDGDGGGNKSNFTDEFPLLNTATSRINKREQINRVEITKSRGNARRWRVRARARGARTVGNIVAFINGPIFEDGIFVAAVSLLAPAVRAGESSPLVLVIAEEHDFLPRQNLASPETSAVIFYRNNV